MSSKHYFLLAFLMFFVAGPLTKVIKAQTLRAMSNHTTGMYSVAYVTTSKEEEAKTLARGLVKEKLAACVNIIPGITSVYEWKGNIEEDKELLLMIKTRTEKIQKLTEYVKKHHSYEVVEVISFPIVNGNEDYLNWIGQVVPRENEKIQEEVN